MMFKKLKLEELNRLAPDVFKQTKKLPITIVLENIRSAANVGSIFRTSDAFLVKEIIITGITPIPPHKEIRKTALGSSNTVDWRYTKSAKTLLTELKKNHNCYIYSVEQTSNSSFLSSSNFNISKDRNNIFVFGNEVNGVSQEIIDISHQVIEIKQFGTKHSLNVSVSFGIVMWETCKRIINT